LKRTYNTYSGTLSASVYRQYAIVETVRN